jgi:hypothetical protein
MQGEEVQSLLPPILVNLDTVILCQLHYGSRPGVHCFNVLAPLHLPAGWPQFYLQLPSLGPSSSSLGPLFARTKMRKSGLNFPAHQQSTVALFVN